MDEIETRAREMGWKPQGEFKGPEDKWVDAAEYVRRGEEVLPIVRNENRRLQQTATQLQQQIEQLQSALNESRQSMTEFKQFQADMLQTKLKEQRVQLLREIREAREAGNDDKIVELEDQLAENRTAVAAAKAPAPAPAASPAPAPATTLTAEQQAVYDAWVKRNPWAEGSSDEDIAKQGAALRFGQEAARLGKRGAEYFDFVDAKMEKAFASAPAPSKTEEGRPGGGSGTSGAGGKDYKSLPAEAKAYVDSRADQFVGPNKMFKTKAEWQNHYAKVYYQQEAA